MDALWGVGPASVREIQEAMPRRRRPAYTTVQTIVYRLEAKGAVRRVKKIGNANVFEPLITQGAARTKLVDDLLSVFGGSAQPFMAHLIETGRITREDLDEARRRLDELSKPTKSKGKQR